MAQIPGYFYLLILNTGRHVAIFPPRHLEGIKYEGKSTALLRYGEWSDPVPMKPHVSIKTQSIRWREGSVGKVQATEARGPEFRSPAPGKGWTWRECMPGGLLAIQSTQVQ